MHRCSAHSVVRRFCCLLKCLPTGRCSMGGRGIALQYLAPTDLLLRHPLPRPAADGLATRQPQVEPQAHEQKGGGLGPLEAFPRQGQLDLH